METGFPKQTFRTKTSQVLRQKQIGRMKLGQLFSLPETEFRKLIEELENTSLFRKLVDEWKVISYRKFREVRPLSSVELKEETILSSDTFDLEELLHQNPETVPLLQKIGQAIGRERFNKLLQGGLSIGEVERDCRLAPKETETLKNFLNRFELEKLISSSAVSSPESSLSPADTTYKIASIEREGDKLVIYPHLKEDYLIKGKYSIDYRRYEELHRKRIITERELKRISQVFSTLNLVNRRTTTIYQIICHIKEIQSDYLHSGDIGRLRPLTRRELARRIGVHPSSITRVTANKSIGTPQRKELSLKFFLPSQKEIIKNYVKEIIDQEKVLLEIHNLEHPYTDELIKDKLYQNYQIGVSRRAVAKYRKELKVPCSNRRMRERRSYPDEESSKPRG